MAEQTTDRIDWYRTPIDREELKKLTSRSDARALLQSVGFLLILAVTGTAAWIAWEEASVGRFPVWAVILLTFCHGSVWAFLLQGFHELVHHTVFKTKWLGTFFVYLYSFLGWWDPIYFKASHTRHHLYTLHPPQDGEVVLPRRIRVRNYIKVAIVDPVGIYSRLSGFLKAAMGRYGNPPSNRANWQREIMTEDGPKVQRQFRRYNRLFLLGHAAIVAVAIVTGLWQLLVLVTFAPFYGRWLQYLCNESQHVGLTDNVPDFRLCCRTFTMNRVVSFLHWNMNYHIEHHMYAAVPCYRMRQLHKLIRHEFPEITHGVVSTWRQIIQILGKQERDPTYHFLPVVPGPAADSRR